MSTRNGRAVTLTNSSIEALLKRKDVLKAFPRMAGISKRLASDIRGCSCSGKTHKHLDRAVQDVKQLMSVWSSERKNTLKKLLKADVVRMYVGKKMVEF